MKTSQKWSESLNEKIFFMNIITSIRPGETRYSARDHLKPINFYCAAPRAHLVELAGDFNDWQPLPMQPSVDGWWLAQVNLCHGHHQYRFMVDGRPVLDPHAAGSVRNEQGDQVSLIAVS